MAQTKNRHNEAFPVGWLTSKKLRPLITGYYDAARLADDIADAPNLSAQEKTVQLAAIRNAFLNPAAGNDLSVIRRLGKMFADENLDSSLFLDLLKAFEADSLNSPIRIWEELLAYCRFSAAPVGRFMLAIQDENISGYIPAENLCIILQILNHLSDIKADLSLLNRCYIPQDMLENYGVRASDMGLSYSKPAVKDMLAAINAKLEKMLMDASILPSLIKNFRLRAEIGVILSLTNSMIQKNKRADILQNPPRLNKFDWLKAFVYGVGNAVFSRRSYQGRIL